MAVVWIVKAVTLIVKQDNTTSTMVLAGVVDLTVKGNTNDYHQ